MDEKDCNRKDLEDYLRRGFVKDRYDFIIYDGQTRRDRFLREVIELAESKGWVNGKWYEEEQYSAIHYRLTKKGKKYFGIT